MKFKFDSDYKLPLNNTIEIHVMVIVVRAIFYENKKHYPQVFLDKLSAIIVKIFCNDVWKS